MFWGPSSLEKTTLKEKKNKTESLICQELGKNFSSTVCIISYYIILPVKVSLRGKKLVTNHLKPVELISNWTPFLHERQ